VRQVPRRAAAHRPVERSESLPDRDEPSVPVTGLASPSFRPDAYQDYGRFLTPEGGILLIYKDIDLRWRHTFWRIFAWAASTGGEGWYLFHHSPVEGFWLNLLCLLALGWSTG
jgi:hypothetical protein